jgi:hypothetical protein
MMALNLGQGLIYRMLLSLGLRVSTRTWMYLGIYDTLPEGHAKQL